MSTMPLFASAPRVHLKIGNNTLGYAIGFNFNISVDVQPVYAIGHYNAIALEPTYYNVVTGTIQIMRLSHVDARQSNLASSNSNPIRTGSGSVASTVLGWDGSSQTSATNDATDAAGLASSNAVLGSPGSLYAHLDPSKVLMSQLFDMDVYLTVQTSSDINGTSKLTDAALKAKKAAVDGLKENQKWFTIAGCRITSRNTNITFGQIVNEPVSFNGLIVLPEGCGFQDDNLLKDA